MLPIYSWKRKGLAAESLPWQYILPLQLPSLHLLFALHLSSLDLTCYLAQVFITHLSSSYLKSSDQELCPTGCLIQQSHTSMKLLNLCNKAKESVDCEHRHKGDGKEMQGNRNLQEQLNRDYKEASEIHLPETEGCRHQALKAKVFRFEARKPEPKSSSQRCCLRKSL